MKYSVGVFLGIFGLIATEAGLAFDALPEQPPIPADNPMSAAFHQRHRLL